MNDIQVFSNPAFGSVRTVDIDGEPWFVGKDVTTALGYADNFGALKKHCDPEDKLNCQNDSFESPRGLTIINESGLYSLILTSKLPAAKAFKRWITSEVLPAIRKTGAYSTEREETRDTAQRGLTVDDYIKAAQIVASCRNERLPYVTKMLENAGIQFLQPTDSATFNKEIGIKAIQHINTAVSKYGWTETAIGKLIGIDDNVQIHRYRSGITIPRETRARLIISALEKAIPELAETM